MKKLFLLQERPGILPSIYGLAYFSLIVDVFALGYYRNAGSYHTVGLTLIVLGMVAMIQTNSNIASVVIENIRAELGAEGENIRLTLVLRNKQPEPRYNLKIMPSKKFPNSEADFLAELRTRATVQLQIPCPKRGIYALESIRIESRGIYGLFSTWKTLDADCKLIVYPKPDGSLPLPVSVQGGTMHGLTGEDFIGHRTYQTGASLKQVDWKAYARGQGLLLKEFGMQVEGAVHLDFAHIQGNDAELKLRQLSAWLFACASQNRPFSLSLPEQSLALAAGPEQLQVALTKLAECRAST